MKPARRTRGNAGFTLVEVLVALVVTGLVSLVLLYGIRLATLGFDRLSRHAERLDERRGVEMLLRRTVGLAVADQNIDGQGRFSGTPSRLTFLALAEDSGPGLYRVEIAVDAARSENPVIFTQRPAQPTASPQLRQTVLARQSRGFRIAYFGATSVGAEPAWQDRWENLAYLPKLVRITFDSGDGLVRPAITVRVWNAG
jgi:general secretion pathway protein J